MRVRGCKHQLIAGVIKEKNPNIKGVLADPIGSTMGGGEHADYDIEGIGNDFIADTMNMSLVDIIIKVSDNEAFENSRELVKKRRYNSRFKLRSCYGSSKEID